MCGIAGIVNFSRKEFDIINSLMDMNAAQRHRGPDDEGYLLANNQLSIAAAGNDTPDSVLNNSISYLPNQNINDISGNYHIGLGHRRLSILDLSSAGHQPMSIDSNIWIVFNGEIYNYIELKEQLIKLGYSFQTATDTEVILNSYKEWGENCVDHFNGMWSFIIYDKNLNTIWGSRDISGVKPLYYFNDTNYFAFASEQIALLKLSFIKKEINTSAVFDLFAFNEIEKEPESFFKNIIELPPAHSFALNLNENKLEIWKHYSPKVNYNYEPFNNTKSLHYSNEIEEKLFNSIKLRLRSDVPVGSCLSGGIDSSSIVCITNELLKKTNTQDRTQKVFTTSFKNKAYDESHWAKIIANHTGANWFQTFPTKDNLLNDIEELVKCQNIPLISTRTYAQFRVMQLIKENNIKVVLDGQGGDELFGGYHHHYYPYWRGLINNGKYNSFINEFNHTKTIPNLKTHFLKSFIKETFTNKIPLGLKPNIHRIKYRELNYLNKDFLNENNIRYETEKKHKNRSASLNNILEFDFFSGPLKYLLRCEDRCSMHFSIESRTPFSDDRELIDYLFTIPSSYKIHNGISKHLLRSSMENHLPESIRNRQDKMGFTTPNNYWIRELRNEFKGYFENDTTGIIDKNQILNNYDNFFNPENSEENFRIFKFISFVIWLKIFEMK